MNRRELGSGSLGGLGVWWMFAAALVLGVAIIIAIAQKSGSVRVRYIVWDSSVSLIVVALTTALAAILLDQAGGLRNSLGEIRNQISRLS